MCRIIKNLLLVSGFLLPLEIHAESVLPDYFEANYNLYRKGARIAKMQRHFTQQDDGTYKYRSETRTAGLVSLIRKDHIIEETTWKYFEGQFKPQLYTYIRTGGKKNRDVSIHFDWENNLVRNSVDGSNWRMPVQANILDKLLYQLVIMQDLKIGKSAIEYYIADGGKIKTYNINLLGEEIVSTPIGNFKTLKLNRLKANSKRKTTFWCAYDLHFLPIKVENMEKDGKITLAMISSVKGLAN